MFAFVAFVSVFQY